MVASIDVLTRKNVRRDKRTDTRHSGTRVIGLALFFSNYYWEASHRRVVAHAWVHNDYLKGDHAAA
jgi:hypothetical protein